MQQKLKKPTTHLQANLQFVRHGQSAANVEGILAGQYDSPLTDLGRQQAIDAGKLLHAAGQKFDVIVTSGLQRAQETAALIAKEAGYDETIVTMPELNERNGGAYQGGAIQKFYDASDDEIVSAGGESLAGFAQRTAHSRQLLGELAGRSVLVVGHAEWFRILQARARGIAPEQYTDIPVPENGKLYPLPEIEVAAGSDANADAVKRARELIA